MYLGPSKQGLPKIANSAVVFQHHVSRTLATTDDIIFAVSQDRGVKYVRRPQSDTPTSKRLELFYDLLADYLPTYSQLTASQPVVKYCISGQFKSSQVQHVTATDCLRLLVREEGLNSEAKKAALKALDSKGVRFQNAGRLADCRDQ